jgi:2-polyprenyl-3-methyl-5-hydroxy-6-metoxy-1,4-benzoquinol methylase
VNGMGINIDKCPLCESSNQQNLYDDFEGNHYVRCRNCTLVFQNPRKLIEYEEDYWKVSIDPDGNRRVHAEEKDKSLKNEFIADINYINKMVPGRILDSGAGYGFFLSGINDSWDKYAIELSDYCIKHIKDNNKDGVTVNSERIEDSHFENDYFEVIYFYHVIEHIDNVHGVMSNLVRMLKPGGLLIISTPNIESFVAKRFEGNYRLLGAAHILMWSKQTLLKLLKQYNLYCEKINYPYFRTDFFRWKFIRRLFDRTKISPPFYGNIITIYARKKS